MVSAVLASLRDLVIGMGLAAISAVILLSFLFIAVVTIVPAAIVIVLFFSGKVGYEWWISERQS